MENKVTNPRYYTLEEVCDLYSLNKLDLLKFMRNKKILHSERFIFVQERKKKNIYYNLPTNDYIHLFKIKMQRGKNGVINRKILFSDKGLDFIGKIAPAVNILKF